MIVLKDYTIKEQNGIYYIITSSTPNCPDCGGELKTRDSKKRKLISSDRDGEYIRSETLQVQRVWTGPDGIPGYHGSA